MDKATLELLVQQAQPGDTLVLRFARTAVGDMSYLYGMHKYGFIQINSGDYLVVLAVLQSREWGGDWNRTVRVTVQQCFQEKENLDWFVGRMKRPLETLRAIRQKEPERLYYRVTDKEKAPWHSNGERPTAWTFGQDQDESSIATALKKAGLI